MLKGIIKMNTKTVCELKVIAKNPDLHGYYMLKKTDLIALLSEESTEEIPRPPPRTKRYKRKRRTKIISSSQEMDKFEIKNSASKVSSPANNSILRPFEGVIKTLKGDVEDEAEKENEEETDDNIDLTPHENVRTFKGSFRSFLVAAVS